MATPPQPPSSSKLQPSEDTTQISLASGFSKEDAKEALKAPTQYTPSLNHEDLENLLVGNLKRSTRPNDKRLLESVQNILRMGKIREALDRNFFPNGRSRYQKSDGETVFIPPGRLDIVLQLPPPGKQFASGSLITPDVKHCEDYVAQYMRKHTVWAQNILNQHHESQRSPHAVAAGQSGGL